MYWRLEYYVHKIFTDDDIDEFDSRIMLFCQECEVLYGEESITPNMHLHGHVASCLIDYGPVYSFWLSSFERYNGYLGNFPNNGRSGEKQFMRTFLRDSYVNSINVSNDYKSQIVRSSARYKLKTLRYISHRRWP